MRSFSIHIGRLFGVEVRLHLTFLLLPLFVFWTEYNVHGSANGGRDLALVGLVLLCVAAHEAGHMLVAWRAGLVSKAVILLPLSGVTVYEESRTQPGPSSIEAWRRDVLIALIGPLVNIGLAALSVAVIYATGYGANLWKWPFFQSGNLPRSLVWTNIYIGRDQSAACVSAGWGKSTAGIFCAEFGCVGCNAAGGFNQPRAGDAVDGGRLVQRHVADNGGRHYLLRGATRRARCYLPVGAG